MYCDYTCIVRITIMIFLSWNPCSPPQMSPWFKPPIFQSRRTPAGRFGGLADVLGTRTHPTGSGRLGAAHGCLDWKIYGKCCSFGDLEWTNLGTLGHSKYLYLYLYIIFKRHVMVRVVENHPTHLFKNILDEVSSCFLASGKFTCSM